MTMKNGLVRISELSTYKLDDIQHDFCQKNRVRISKKNILDSMIDLLITDPSCMKKLSEHLIHAKADRSVKN
jgi:hypothetical protein